MARAKNEINASSTADIAFLLLIFYLVTTTMNVDSGITRILPPIADQSKDKGLDNLERNTLQVRINHQDKILAGGKPISIEELKDIAKEFILNPNDEVNLPQKEETEIELLGTYPVPKGIISLMNDKMTTYDVYVQVQNELTKAYNEVWDEVAHQKFGKPFEELDDARKDAIRKKAVPQKISEAEPVDLSKKAKK